MLVGVALMAALLAIGGVSTAFAQDTGAQAKARALRTDAPCATGQADKSPAITASYDEKGPDPGVLTGCSVSPHRVNFTK